MASSYLACSGFFAFSFCHFRLRLSLSEQFLLSCAHICAGGALNAVPEEELLNPSTSPDLSPERQSPVSGSPPSGSPASQSPLDKRHSLPVDQVGAFRVLLLGSRFAGKTSLCSRFRFSRFLDSAQCRRLLDEDESADGAMQQSKSIEVDGTDATLELLDSEVYPDHPQYWSLLSQHVRCSDVVCLCFSVAAASSLDVCRQFHAEVQNLKDQERPMTFLVALQCDLPATQHRVSRADAVSAARDLQVHAYYECSAKLNANCTEIFSDCVRLYVFLASVADLVQRVRAKIFQGTFSLACCFL